jgi:hypothetical protein
MSVRMCPKHCPSNEKLDTKQRGRGRKFSYTRESNLSRDHIKKATRFTSCGRGKEDEQAKRLCREGSNACNGGHGYNNLEESCHLEGLGTYGIVHHA